MRNLILLHGALGNAAQFEYLEELLDVSFNVYSFNLSGHGDKNFDGNLSIEAYADELYRFAESKNLDEFYVFGHSMGGYIALFLHLKGYSALKGVFTLGTKLYWDPSIAELESRMLNPAKVKEKVPHFAQALEKTHGEKWESLMAAISEMLKNMGIKAPISVGDYESIKIPVQIGIGDRDKMVSLEETIDVYRRIPACRLLVIPNTPHPFEQADSVRLAQEIMEFFGEE